MFKRVSNYKLFVNLLVLFNKMQFKIYLFNKTKLEINFNYFREALRGTLRYGSGPRSSQRYTALWLGRPDRFRKGAKSASGVPGPKSALRGSKWTTFAPGIFQPFELRNSSLIQ